MSVGSPPAWPLPEPIPFAPRRFTVEEYRRLGETGVLSEDDRVELLEGVITPKMMHNPPHDGTIMRIDEAIRASLPAGWTIRIQSSLTTPDSEPEPDVAIVRGRPIDYLRRHPTASDTGLVIEVADASLLRDRNKARLYTRAGVSTYWIVNLLDEQVEVLSAPSGPCDNPSYKRTEILRRGEHVPLTLAGQMVATILADDMLP